jgi:enediyne core biosynthesis thioesterase
MLLTFLPNWNVNLRCSCEYLAKLKAFDVISVRMFLGATVQNRIAMRFEYWRENQPRELVARGEQEIACMRRQSLLAISTLANSRSIIPGP